MLLAIDLLAVSVNKAMFAIVSINPADTPRIILQSQDEPTQVSYYNNIIPGRFTSNLVLGAVKHDIPLPVYRLKGP